MSADREPAILWIHPDYYAALLSELAVLKSAREREKTLREALIVAKPYVCQTNPLAGNRQADCKTVYAALTATGGQE